jgi:2-keto-4-pentenoate hydratase/2-oxohepta-3-ene-1,7-dioic acid hydratase in catechol pathway
MPETFFVATIADAKGPTAAVVQNGAVHVVPGRPSMADLLATWSSAVERLADDLERGGLEGPLDVHTVRFLPPVPLPPNLYMAGANYADHLREMRRLGPDDPVDKPAAGPFMFLKPTTTLVGHRGPIVLPSAYRKVDWEVELAAVIGRRAHRVSAAEALAHVAGYTVANDVSVRDAFRRGGGATEPMVYDWLAQKGCWTSCPCGPWMLPSAFCPEPGNLEIRLTVNGDVQQQSRTSEMIFSLEEIIEYLSRIVPLVPGDVICTGTCAGVGAGKNRFLADGDVVVAQVEGIGSLENEAVAESDSARLRAALGIE